MSTVLRTYKHLAFFNHKSKLLSKQLFSIRSAFVLPFARIRNYAAYQSASFQLRPYTVRVQEVESDSNLPLHQHTENTISANTELSQKFHKLEADSIKFGRVFQRDVESILTTVKTIGHISGTQGLLLIKSCGSALPEMGKAERGKLVNDVWSTLHELNFTFDVSHYNALLKVYLDNEHNLDTVEFLSMMQRQEIEPNKVTYQRLVSHYCQSGDINGASKILELMKSKGIPMNELVFNDLIMGNVRGNNIEDGKNIIGVMRNANLPINSATYTSLACGYATLGDITNVLATIQEAATENEPLFDKDVLDIIYTLSVSGHELLVEQVLPLTPRKRGYSQECIVTILELINKGFHKVGFLLLNTMPTARAIDGSAAPSGTFFIRQLVKQNVDPDVIIGYCNEMKTRGLRENALLKATEMALNFRKPDLAVTFMKELHSQGCDIRPHFFWPVLACKRGNEKDLYDIMKRMVDLKCPADDETFLTQFFPNISISDPCSVINQLKMIGYEEKDFAASLTLFLIQNGVTQIPAVLLEKHSIESRHLMALAKALALSQDAITTVQILQSLDPYYTANSAVNRHNNIYGAFLYQFAVSKQFSASLLQELLAAMEEKDLKLDVSDMTLEVISNKLDPYSKVQISNHLKKLGSSKLPAPLLQKRNFSRTEMGESTSREGPSRMLLFHSRQKNLHRVKEILAELDEQNFTYSGIHYASLIEMYSFHEDLEKALYYKGLLDKQFPDYPIKEHTIINLATTLIKQKKIDDAENLLLTHHIKHGKQEDPSLIIKNIQQLLNSLAESEEPERTQTFFDTLLDYGYCTPLRVLIKPLIQAHLLKNNTNQAVEEFLRCVKTYKCTPPTSEFFSHLICQEDMQSLQKVTDAAVSVYGEACINVDLAKSFIDCGRFDQAKSLFQTPGLRVRMNKVNQICEFYVSRKMVKELEFFLQMTKCVLGLNRDQIYFHLLKAYVQDECVEKALSVWEKLQEEDIQPSDHTLRFLGTFLQKMNHPVPFAIPDLPPDMTFQHTNRNELVKEILDKTNMMHYLNASQRSMLKGKPLGFTDTSEIMKLLLENEHLKEAFVLCENLFESGFHPTIEVARLLALKLAQAGDKDSLLRLQEKLPETVAKNIPFRDYIASAYVTLGQTDEFLTSLEYGVSEYKDNFPGGGLLKLLAAKPDTLDRVKNLTDMYYQEGLVTPRNMLWIHLMNNHNFEEAEKIFESTPEMKSELLFDSVIKTSKEKNDVEVSQKLLAQAKNSTLSKIAKGNIYSNHITILLALQKVDEALNNLKELQTLMNLDELTNKTRTFLLESLEMAGVRTPFVVP